MKKLLIICTALLFTITACHKEEDLLDIPENWCYSKTSPAGCIDNVNGDYRYFLIIRTGNMGYKKIHKVWMYGSEPAKNNNSQMLFGETTYASEICSPEADSDLYNKVVPYFANNPRAYIVVTLSTDTAQTEVWGLTNF